MIYHLEVEAKFCNVNGILNGFPIYNLNGIHPAIFSRPINAALIGKNNILKFIINSANPQDLKQKYSIKGSIKQYFSGEQMTGPDQGTEITTFSQENFPTAAVTFDNEIFNYSSLLTRGVIVENKEELKDYGEALRTLLIQQNIELIMTEFEPKLSAYAIAYSIEKDLLTKQFSDYLNDKYFANNPILNFTREEIYLRPWCDKRIWEIGIGPEFTQLMQTEANEDGFEYVTKIFVAKINKNFKVVR